MNPSLRLLASFSAATLAVPAASAAAPFELRFIGQQTLPTGTQFQGTEVGGLSGIDYDASTGRFFAISDDRSQINPARFYDLSLNLTSAAFTGVNFHGVETLKQPDGTTFPALSLDPEAIRLDPVTRTLYWTSEGEKVPARVTNPFTREANLDGTHVRELTTPAAFFPTAPPDTTSGIRNNLAFESLTLAPDRDTLFTATENALYQDGPAATTAGGTVSRILSYDRVTGLPGAEYAYLTEPVVAEPVPAGSFATLGLVEMLALSDTEFFTLERSFSTGVGNAILLFHTSIAGATDVSGLASLTGGGYTPATKTLLLDLAVLGIPLDNVEGLSWGPVLDSGSRSLILVSDNNFSATQFTQFLAFEVVPEPSTVAAGALLTLGVAGWTILRRRA